MVNCSIVFLFSGQGSHHFQMGRELYEDVPAFRRWMDRLDVIATPMAGRSIARTLFDERNKMSQPWDDLLETHPAIFMVQYCLAQVLIEQGLRPHILLSTSMGAFAAAAVANCMPVTSALAAVIRQAETIRDACPTGGMLAILSPIEYAETAFLRENCDLAGIHFPGHMVVAAPVHGIALLETQLRSRGIGFQRLSIPVAFHSRWIDPARDAYLEFLRGIPARTPEVPMILCGAQEDLWRQRSPNFLWDVVRQPIRFYEALSRLDAKGPHRYIDLSPAGTLATFLRYALKEGTPSTVASILSPFARGDAKRLQSVFDSYRG